MYRAYIHRRHKLAPELHSLKLRVEIYLFLKKRDRYCTCVQAIFHELLHRVGRTLHNLGKSTAQAQECHGQKRKGRTRDGILAPHSINVAGRRDIDYTELWVHKSTRIGARRSIPSRLSSKRTEIRARIGT